VHRIDICEVCVHIECVAVCFVLKCSVLECYVFHCLVFTLTVSHLRFFPHCVRLRKNTGCDFAETLLLRADACCCADTTNFFCQHATSRTSSSFRGAVCTHYLHTLPISSPDVCVCCVLQCVAACCSVLQCVAVCEVQIFALRSSTHCNALQHTATHCNTLQHTTTHCNTLQHTATHCNTLHNAATHYTAFFLQNRYLHTSSAFREAFSSQYTHKYRTCTSQMCAYRMLQCVAAACCSALQLTHIVGISRSNFHSIYTHTSHMYVPDVCV